MLYISKYKSKIGNLTLASDEENLIGLWIEGQKYYLYNIKEEMQENNNIKIIKQTKLWLDKYFKGEKVSPKELKLAPRGSIFQKTVWNILCEIPYGKTTTYGKIATEIAKIQNKKSISAQAVGGAVGHNPISIIIPCHRVIGANGNLTGYAGGIQKKIELLKIEKGYYSSTIVERRDANGNFIGYAYNKPGE